ISPEASPAGLFNRLFANFTAPDTNDPTFQIRANVLDAVKDDAKRLSARLGSQDRSRLDQHLTGISELRRQIIDATPPPSSCVEPAAVSDDNEREQIETVSKLMSDLLASAWACDLNRVASFQLTGAVGGTVLSNLGHRLTTHTISHLEGGATEEDCHQCALFAVKRFAYLLGKLKSMPDGSGNLLDRSCLFFTTDVAEGPAHSTHDYPILVAGRAGGALKYPGVHVRSNSGENTSDVLLSCLQAVGTGVTSVGKDGGYSNRPCSGILA
ncbi:MAG TPA: DUF1552 domain-containing protein, partial [Myxococcaceae bacterium]|nr:DUF1552 domain-containing protein [Myxococcaceae bacterium]